MKIITSIIVGYGDRGSVYGNYAITDQDKFKVIGVVDTNPYKLKLAKERFGLNDNQLYSSIEECLKTKPKVDLFINGTMDQDHYKVIKKILLNGYDLLTEKPIVENKEKLLEIQKLAEENKCKVFVCHVLRYTPFYRTIKQMILDGKVGEIISIQMSEHVGLAHYAGSYIRGKWNNEKDCMSSFLLAKSCHDLDVMCWLNNVTVPIKVSCFGGREYFIRKNAPEGSTETCFDCPHENTCLYSALKHYLQNNYSSNLTWPSINKPLKDITKEDKVNFLKNSLYGKCVWKVDEADIVDRETMIFKFKNGSIGTFNLIGGAPQANRYIHIVGTLGEISGVADKGIITYAPADRDHIETQKLIIDVNKEINTKFGVNNHFGGDYAIMESIVEYLNGNRDCISLTSINDSINGHLCAYGAEEARKENIVLDLEKYGIR